MSWQAQYDAVPTGPAWLTGLRERAFARFTEQGLPRARKTPGWRHTSVADLGRASLDPVTPGTSVELPPATDRVVLVDGRYAPELSSPPAGVTVRALTDALDVVRPILEAGADSPNGVFVTLNAAMIGQGVVIDATGQATLHLVHVATASGAASHPRVVVRVHRGAELVLVEEHGARDATRYLVNQVSDVTLDAGAALVHLRVQDDEARSWHLSDVRVHVGRDARYRALTLSVGAGLSRTAVHALLDAPGAEVALYGLTLARDAQHHDHPVLVEHRAPHGTSRQVYEGILDGAARGVFTGVVKVHADGIKTDSSQLNRNLLLSDTARADSEPMLEIETDDVIASHGSAIGSLDDDALFYLRARGVGVAEARRMLTRAFATEVVDAAPEAIRPAAEAVVTRWLQELA